MKNAGTSKTQMTSMDEKSGLTTVLDSDHSQIHAGRFYTIFNFTQSVANNGLIYLELKTPPATDYLLHMKGIQAVSSSAKTLITITEAPTLTTGVTAITPRNRNRIFGNAAQTVVKKDPTTISGGTILDSIFLGAAGTTNNPVPFDELELKADTTYLIAAQNLSGSPADMLLRANFYEVGM